MEFSPCISTPTQKRENKREMEQLQTKLFEAATRNSITSLQQLLIDDPLILERSLVNRFNETPLHVAAMLGHVDFVREIIRLQPKLVNELNSHLSSPLHLAAAKGHVGVVKALLSVDNQACLARDRNELLPVHFAAAKGHIVAIKLMFEARPEVSMVRACRLVEERAFCICVSKVTNWRLSS